MCPNKIECPVDRYRKLKNYLSRLILDSNVNYALHYWTLIKLIVARVLGKNSFLTRYSNGHTK
jgi:hypothetical protein